MNQETSGRRPLRLRSFDYSDSNQVYFVTVAVRRDRTSRAPRRPFLNAGLAGQVVGSLSYLREQKGVSLLCYCLMPDHLHLLLSLPDGSRTLMDIMHDFKSYTTRIAWSCGWKDRLWARSFYERVVRSESEFRETCQYILGNPVRAGLVEKTEDYALAGVIDPLPL